MGYVSNTFCAHDSTGSWAHHREKKHANIDYLNFSQYIQQADTESIEVSWISSLQMTSLLRELGTQ